MAKRYNKEESRLIERAISFLVVQYGRTGFNEKPVIFHSLRVACRLAEFGAQTSTVAAAVLHDLLEDSHVTLRQLEKKFGKRIGNLVSSVSFDMKIQNKTDRYRDMLMRTKKGGAEALIIKCVDILDNSEYYSFGTNQSAEKLLMEKASFFLKLTEPKLKHDPFFRELKKRYRFLSLQMKRAYLK